jgi:hypothetical protein
MKSRALKRNLQDVRSDDGSIEFHLRQFVHLGSTDANNPVGMGIPAVAVGAVMDHQPHRLEEFADASTMVPGIKSLVALAVSLTTH